MKSLTGAEENVIRGLINEWRSLWSPGEEEFSFRDYEHLYLTTDEFLAYDSLSPTSTQINGWQAYTTLWEGFMNQRLKNWRITNLQVVQVSVAGELTWGSLNYYGQGIFDGKAFEGSQHGTHIWRKLDGQWRIVHEHLSGPIRSGSEN